VDAIYLAVNGQRLGPYTLDQLRQSLARNEIARDTPAWHDGLPAWVPLERILATTEVPPPVPGAVLPASLVAEHSFTPDQLREIARSQNLLMWSILAGILSFFISFALRQGVPIIGFLFSLGVIVFEVVALYRLGRSLRMTAPWLYCPLLIIPLVGLITLVIISGRASRVLKAYGVRIGLMGGKISDIQG
jgi:hypothetical protein